MDNWQLIFESIHIHEVQILKGLLESKQIESILIDKSDSVYPTNGAIELYVLNEDALKARHIINTNFNDI